jgi:hypothetical protein
MPDTGHLRALGNDVTAHVVLSARRSNVPGHWVRRCSNPACSWQAHDPDPVRLAELARAHHEDPDGLNGVPETRSAAGQGGAS